MSDEQNTEPVADEALDIDAATTDAHAETDGQPETGADDVQAQLDKWKTLARRNEAKAKANAEAAKRAHEAEERAAAAEARIAELSLTNLRTSIAAEFGGIPADALTGDDEQSLRASAEKVLAWVEGQRKPASNTRMPLRSGTQGLAPASAPGERTVNALRNTFGG